MDAIDQAFLDFNQARGCVLFPPDLDFSKVCFCDECRPKIETLNEFQKEIKAKQRLVSAYSARGNNKEDLCLIICTGSQWTKLTLDFFRKKLIAVSGVALKFEKSKLEVIDEQIVQRLREVGVLHEQEEEVPDDDVDDDRHSILEKIDGGRFYYGKTKAKYKADVLFQEIENVEKHWEMAKKEDEAHKLEEKKDPCLNSIILLEKLDKKDAEARKLEKQIELLKELPIEDLQHEIEDLIPEFFPREPRNMIIKKANDCIFGACYTCISKRKEFWQRSPLATEGNGHSELKKTLDSLMEEVNLFKEQWDKEFAFVFSPHDRSDMRRQKIE